VNAPSRRARRAAAELVDVDGAPPRYVARVTRVGVRRHDSTSCRAYAIGADHEVGRKRPTVGQ